MDNKKEKLIFFIFILILLCAFVFIPLYLSNKNFFLGGDSVGQAGGVEQAFLKLKKGEINLINIFFVKGAIFNDINWPDGYYLPPNISNGINVILRFFFHDEISAYTATMILYEILNILSVFFILKKILKINIFLSLFFSMIFIFFPYFYYRLHHQSLVAVWQEIFVVYFILRFIDKPQLKYCIGILFFIFINIFFNIQLFYFLFLSFFPAGIIVLTYRIRNLKKGNILYFKRFFSYTIIMIILSGIIFYLSPYSNKNILNKEKTKNLILPVRQKSEINAWKSPIYHIFLPVDQNILFGKITGRKFKSAWGYHEKAIYLGLSFLMVFFLLLYKIYKNNRLLDFKNKILNYNFKNLILISGFFTFLFAVFWTLAPALKLSDFLYFINKSARVYSRAISLAIVFWVIIFAYLFHYSIKENLISKKLIVIILLFIFFDIYPKSFKPLTLKLERCPEEYIFLSEYTANQKTQKLLDFFGKYGGYAEYGFLLYKKCHNLIDFDSSLIDNKWDKNLYDILKKYDVKYILFYKNNKEKNMDEIKIKNFIKNFDLKKIYENKRSIIVKI